MFIDGCFWHGCPEHYIAPLANSQFWAHKVVQNRTRDLETVHLLESAGWIAMRFWEHDSPDLVADRVEKAVEIRRLKPSIDTRDDSGGADLEP